MEYVGKAADMAKHFRETRLSTLKPPQEFISRPKDLNEATSRITYNTRAFSGNYLLIVIALALYAIILNPILLIAILFLFCGFALINKYAPEPIHVGGQVITQKTLYIALFVIGLPLLWFASPVSTFFWLVGSSAILIIGHAVLMEPGIESEYQGLEGP